MPNRILREGILSSERVAKLGWADEVFYRRLMSVVDDFGRYHANPKLLRAALYPLLIDKVSDADIGKWLTSCVTAALVSVYPAPDGKRYLQLLDFRQQLRADKSKYPPMPDGCIADAKQTNSTGEASAPVFGDGDGDGDVKQPTVAPARQADTALTVVRSQFECPHAEILALWSEVLPALPQHKPAFWRGSRADHLRARWRETAEEKHWQSSPEGLEFFRKLFGFVGRSAFLIGKRKSTDGRPPFQCELAWLVEPQNWAKVIEGKFHQEAA